MSTRSTPTSERSPQAQRPEPVNRQSQSGHETVLRVGFWAIGLLFAVAQAWIFRYQVTADSISYLDMSDGVLPGSDWHRLINGVWSPLYPFLLGVFRRVFGISPANEIVDGHLLNIAFFLFAFICFEFFLQIAVKKFTIREEPSASDSGLAPLPTWVILSLGYTLFLWASISEISVRHLRADMLMSGFVYLAVGLLLRMQGHAPRWRDYIALGAVLGIGILSKEILLPVGTLIIAATLFAVTNRRLALRMIAASLAIFLLIGSFYFVPLSRARGRFTLGESGTLNYLLHVNRARPYWYLQTVGTGSGSFVHAPQRIFSSPPAYAFSVPAMVTHPLRFDPSDWIAGARPRFVLKRQIISCIPSVRNIAELLTPLGFVVLAVLALGYVSWKKGRLLSALKTTWPMWTIGLVGCGVYVPVHVEPRYIAEFLALLLFGIILGFRSPQNVGRKAVLAATAVIVASVLTPLAVGICLRYFEYVGLSNADSLASAQLENLGIRPGDRVARISPSVMDLGIERVARVEVVAEVDFEHAQEFWAAPLNTQQEVLDTFISHGARAVIATLQKNQPGVDSRWIHLGSTRYWIWLPDKNPAASP